MDVFSQKNSSALKKRLTYLPAGSKKSQQVNTTDSASLNSAILHRKLEGGLPQYLSVITHRKQCET